MKFELEDHGYGASTVQIVHTRSVGGRRSIEVESWHLEILLSCLIYSRFASTFHYDEEVMLECRDAFWSLKL